MITARRKKRKVLPEINTSVCFALEEVPLRYSHNGQPSLVIDFADLNDIERTRLQIVWEKLIQCLNTLISKAQSLMEGYRHCRFLRNEKKKLLQYNNNINMRNNFLGEKCLNLWCFIRHSLLEVKIRKEVFEDGEVWKKSQVEVLFKDSVVNCSNREWLRDVYAADYILNMLLKWKLLHYTLSEPD